MMATRHVGSRTIEVTREDKVFFPGAGLTKGDLVDYYHRVAGVMIPHLEGRPLTLHRYPDGIDEEGFFQQQIPDYFPDWIRRVTAEKQDGQVTHAVCDDAATLVYLANQGCITPHAWLSRADDLHHPDRMIFDLDPPGDIPGSPDRSPGQARSGAGFDRVRQGARWLRDLLGELDLTPFVMTTGSRGLHVVVPLDRSAGFETVRAFARDAARVLVHRHPDALTVEQRKAKRQDRLFLDTLRNAYGQTSVPPYAVRARPGAPVATPLDWGELGDARLHPRRYTIANLFRRLGQKDDPWHAMDRHAARLAAHRPRLDGIMEFV